jgi:hypothetical protein
MIAKADFLAITKLGKLCSAMLLVGGIPSTLVKSVTASQSSNIAPARFRMPALAQKAGTPQVSFTNIWN